MRKSDLVKKIVHKTGMDKDDVITVIEAFMTEVKMSLCENENVYLRGFGSFVIKERAKKVGRDISRNTSVIIPTHNTPSFKPAKSFKDQVKQNSIKE